MDKRMITVVGIGMNIDTVTSEGLKAIEAADILYGAPRMLEYFTRVNTNAKKIKKYLAKEIYMSIEENKPLKPVILVSGDVGFYSLATSITKEYEKKLNDSYKQNKDHDLPYKLSFIPGISSLNYFFAKLKLPWQDVKLVSMHGRDSNIVDAVRRNKLTFALAGKNLHEIGEKFVDCGLKDIDVTIGAALGSDDEEFLKCKAGDLQNMALDKIFVLLFDNQNFEKCIPTGIDDDYFIRGEVPMTKAPIRAFIMSKLNISPTDNFIDIGAGTGSVTIEAALAAYEGQIYAIDKNEGAIELIKANSRKFNIGNITPVLGSAIDVLSELPPFDKAFIGGSSGDLKEIIAALLQKNPSIKIVVTAIALETVINSIEAFSDYGINAEIIQASISRSTSKARLHMMLADNSIYIISGKKNR